MSCLQPGQKTDKQDVREELDKSKAGDDEDNDIGDKHNVSLIKRRCSDSDTDSDQSISKKTRL